MGEQLHAELAVIRSVADRFDDTARAVDAAARIELGGLVFDGLTAGRVHTAGGDAVRRALDRWVPELVRWSRAGAEIAAALRSGAARYAEAELRAAARVG